MNTYILLFIISLIGCNSKVEEAFITATSDEVITVGASRLDQYLPLLKGKKIAGVFNQSSRVDSQHIVDVLVREGIHIQQIYTLEHGFRGKADAGAKVGNDIDAATGISLVSLYGKNKKPSAASLQDIDIVVFDVQDVGVRFYTYISTLHYVLEACAEEGVPVLILDRPNPNGHCVDGPILDPAYQSFIGMHEIPVAHGMTIGEYGMMIKGEGWINTANNLKLEVIPCANYTHDMHYDLPVRPSPNLPNATSIALYPSLCFFEGTSLSIGRGTNKQFQVIGHPALGDLSYSFTPVPMEGARAPKHEDVKCYGEDLSGLSIIKYHKSDCLDLSYLVKYYDLVTKRNEVFFSRPDFFDLLAGSSMLRDQITQGMTEQEIRATWSKGLDQFKKMRQKYLLYK